MATVDCFSCDACVWNDGIKIPVGDDGYPSSVWGRYLPGDEPGYRCEYGVDHALCSDMEVTECPRFVESNGRTRFLCPQCLVNDGTETVLLTDSMQFFCPDCDCSFVANDLSEYGQETYAWLQSALKKQG